MFPSRCHAFLLGQAWWRWPRFASQQSPLGWGSFDNTCLLGWPRHCLQGLWLHGQSWACCHQGLPWFFGACTSGRHRNQLSFFQILERFYSPHRMYQEFAGVTIAFRCWNILNASNPEMASPKFLEESSKSSITMLQVIGICWCLISLLIARWQTTSCLRNGRKETFPHSSSSNVCNSWWGMLGKATLFCHASWEPMVRSQDPLSDWEMDENG